MESYKNEKSNILTPNYKQMNQTLFHIIILNSFKKSQIYTPYFSVKKYLNNHLNSQKQKSNNFMHSYIQMNPTLTQITIWLLL